MKLAVAGLLLIAAVTGCQPGEEAADGRSEGAFAAERASCLARGGNWAPGGKGGFYVCFQPTRDAGKACSKASDCQGECLGKSRSCAPVTPLIGCQDILSESGRYETLCRD